MTMSAGKVTEVMFPRSQLLQTFQRVCGVCRRNVQYSTLPVKVINPRRAFMYVPASSWKMVNKAVGIDVDCIVMDCEDAVALNKKDEARANAVKALNELSFGSREASVRINAVTSGIAEDDLKAVLQADNLPKMINIPKVESTDDLNWFGENMMKYLGNREVKERISLTIMIETALGFTYMREICKTGLDLAAKYPFQLEGVVFGYDDFTADVGCDRSVDMKEMEGVRQVFAVIAKAFRLQAIDSVYTGFKDLDGLKRQSIEASNIGYTGKQVIHPTQVPNVQEAFLPSPERTKWAMGVMTAFEEHQKSGKGAFTYEGKMIDMPVFLQAKNIVHLVEAVKGHR